MNNISSGVLKRLRFQSFVKQDASDRASKEKS
jgi:hypothetical protein